MCLFLLNPGRLTRSLEVVMPLIRIRGLTALSLEKDPDAGTYVGPPREALRELRARLREMIIPGIPGIELRTPDITVDFELSVEPETFPDIIVMVEGLFKQPEGKAERTQEVRQALAEAILTELAIFAKANGFADATKIEVIVKAFEHRKAGMGNGFAFGLPRARASS